MAPLTDPPNPVVRDHGFHRLAIKAVVDETPDTRSFVLDVPQDLREDFRYRPGQFCTFRVRLDETEHLRSYSMSSAPETDADVTVTVKRVPGGLVSNWFNDNLGAGDVVEVTRPAGVFCPRETDRPLVALCGGSGVTPVMSITKSVLATTQRPVRLLYANRHPGSVIFDESLRRLAERHGDRLDLRLHFDSEEGFVDGAGVTDFVSSDAHADFYVCGPGPFMNLVESTLLAMGVEAERIFIERFLVEEQEKHQAATQPGDAAPDVPDEVTIILEGQASTVRYKRGDTLLETARRGGLRPPFSCEAGNCATCMAILRSGSANMRVNNALSPEEVEDGWILTCQSLPRGSSVTVEYEML